MRILRLFFCGFAFIVYVPLLYASDTINISFSEGPSIEISHSKFDKKKHKLTSCGEDYICLIDGKPIWGTDGKIPRQQVNYIKFTNKGFSTELDVSGMYDPMIEASGTKQFSVEHYYDDNWKIRGRFSDGSGSYFVEWLVIKNSSVRTTIGGSESLYDTYHNWFGDKNN